MRIKNKMVWGRVVPAVGGIGLAALLGMMIFPAVPVEVQAEEVNSTVSLTVNPVISIAMQNSVSVDVLPTQTGTFGSSTTSLSVSTNNESGYSLYLATANGENTLASLNPDTTAEITAVDGGTSGVTATNFGNNTWGYYLGTEAVTDATTYKAVPTTSGDTAVIATDAPTETDTYNFAIGTKVDTSLPSGTYSNQVVVSVVANPKVISTWSEITVMQDMTPAICATANVGDTKQLTDSRDNKQYWVTKLADGNCWMTQNLDLDLTNGKPLTSADSDVSSSWNPPRTTETQGTITSANTYTETYSWDLGMYVKSDPDGYSNYCNGVKSLADSSCFSAGWTNVSNMTPMTEGTTNTVTSSGNQYNAHYLVGNLYQWNAATAGTGGTITSSNATDSICPKGWHLPTSNNSSKGSFAYLLNQYNITSNTASTTAITQSPLYFNPSGYVNSGSLWVAGNSGYYWSCTARSSTSYAYYLYFTSGRVNPSDYYYRYYGFSVRCLADGNTTTGGGDSSDNS